MIDTAIRKRVEIFFALARLDPAPPPPLPASGEQIGVVPFTFASGTTVLGVVSAGWRFDRVGVLIDVAFTDSDASVRLGTSADPGLLLDSSDSRPTTIGQYESDALVIIPTTDVLRLSVNPGASPQGGGWLFYKFSS